MFRVPHGTSEARVPPAAAGLALAPALLVLIATLTPIAIKGAPEAPKSGLSQCLAIRETQSRLACYDALAKQQLPVPAKGGEPILPSG